ncbi:hypothetical protein PHYSODRAFT_526276, partial [Phytophthora sojae]
MQFLDEDCRATKPRETQLLSREYYCLLHTNNTVQCTRDDLVLTNSNFIDSGASINAVSPEFCLRAGLEAKIRDHGTMMPITLANKQEMTSFDPYVGDFLILPVPKNQDILLGMPWLKTANPDIDWIEETFSVSGSTSASCSRYFQHGYFSVTSGETKYITRKQFKRLLRKPQDLE